MESQKSSKGKRGLKVKSPLVEITLLGTIFGILTLLYSIGTKNWFPTGLAIVLIAFCIFSLGFIFFVKDDETG
jgi:F0F1-type ATP synthase assembly protein I